jgi:hypothetical protein
MANFLSPRRCRRAPGRWRGALAAYPVARNLPGLFSGQAAVDFKDCGTLCQSVVGPDFGIWPPSGQSNRKVLEPPTQRRTAPPLRWPVPRISSLFRQICVSLVED